VEIESDRITSTFGRGGNRILQNGDFRLRIHWLGSSRALGSLAGGEGNNGLRGSRALGSLAGGADSNGLRGSRALGSLAGGADSNGLRGYLAGGFRSRRALGDSLGIFC